MREAYAASGHETTGKPSHCMSAEAAAEAAGMATEATAKAAAVAAAKAAATVTTAAPAAAPRLGNAARRAYDDRRSKCGFDCES